MLTPEYLQLIGEGAEEIASQLHTDIINAIVGRITRRLGRGDDYILTPTDKWQIEVLQDAGLLREDIEKEIAKRTKLQLKEIRRAFEDAGVTSVEYDDKIYRAAGLSPQPLQQSPHLIRLMQRAYEATQGEWRNYTRTTADEAQKLFIEQCDRAYNLVSTGAMSYTEAVKNAVESIAADGVTITYPSGHTDTIETATLRAVRTGVSQATAAITDARMDEMNWDIILVSSHLGARVTAAENYTNHSWWQGKFYSKSGKDPRFPPFSVCGMGNVQGIHGANCRHHHMPGDGENNPFEQYDSEENRKQFELDQHQRTLERRIRKTKREVMAAKTAMKNGDDATKAEMQKLYERKAALLQKQNKAYNDFCKENGLKKLGDRVRVAGWNRSQASAASAAARKRNKQSGGKIERGSLKWQKKRNADAQKHYEIVRNTDDISQIAHNAQMSEADIQTIKNHIFYNKHIKYDGELERFDPDYDMAVAWKRLSEGKQVETDLLLLKHELLESQVEMLYNLTASEAHAIADEKYPWYKTLVEKLGEEGEADDLL